MSVTPLLINTNSALDKAAKIYVAGHRGLAGSALVRRLLQGGYQKLVFKTRAELELTDQAAVRAFYATEKPEYVFIAAAKVGGIHVNHAYPADFIYRNLMIECNLIHGAFEAGVKKLLFLGSNCIYPKFAPQPMQEELLLTGLLEPTNEPYAVAKIAGIKLCAAYHRQHGVDFFSVIPASLVGLNDNFDPNQSHVLPALIRKMHDAKVRGDVNVTLWGTGKPRREFIASDDMADACVFLMERHGTQATGDFVNIGVGTDLTIKELAELVMRVVGYQGQIAFDTSKPDGVPQKLLDSSRLTALGWQPTRGLEAGIRLAYQDFLQRGEQRA